jgi:hypothetical protein
MPCSMVSSDGVALRLVTAFQSGYRVWGGLARSGGIWVRWSLIWSWFCLASRSTEIHYGNPDHRRHDDSGDSHPRRGHRPIQAAHRSHEVYLGKGVIGF